MRLFPPGLTLGVAMVWHKQRLEMALEGSSQMQREAKLHLNRPITTVANRRRLRVHQENIIRNRRRHETISASGERQHEDLSSDSAIPVP